MENSKINPDSNPWPLGWRAKIGMLMPSTEEGQSTFEYQRLCPEGVAPLVTRMLVPKFSVEGFAKMYDDVIHGSEMLATAGVDVISYVCTAGSFTKGIEWDKALIKEIEDKTGIPATTSASACVEALRFMGIKKVVMFAPYPEDISLTVIKYLQDLGFAVLDHESLGAKSLQEVYRIPPWEIYRGLIKLYKRCPDVDGIFQPGGGMRTLEIAEILEKDTGLPAVLTTPATAWRCLQLAGIKEPVYGFGKLMATPR